MGRTSQDTPTSGLYIRVFGPFEILLNGSSLAVRTPKDLKVLAYLIINHDGPVDRSELASKCWDKDKYNLPIGDSDKFRLLARTLCELRASLLGERRRLVKPSPKAISFEAAGTDLDLLGWEAGLSGGMCDLRHSARIFQEKVLLEDWNDKWVIDARARMESNLISAVYSSAQRASDHGDWVVALGLFALIFELDPGHQDALRQRLQLLYERRRFSEMAQVYDDYLEQCDLHKRAVDPVTRSCYRDLRVQASRFNDGESSGWLPFPVSGFVARPDEMNTIRGMMASSRLATLVGPGGIGKTRLAIAAAAELRDQFFERAWFVDLSEVGDAEAVPRQIALALRLREHPDQSYAEVVFDYLRAKDLLLVLDNCEHLLDACALVARQILEWCPRVKILATSRERLGIPGETIWRVKCLEYPAASDRLAPEDLLNYSAVRLFAERAAQPQRPFTIDGGNAPATVRICRQLDGIPLAIELAAAQVGRGYTSPEEVADGLAADLNILSEAGMSVPTRQRTLRAAIDWSYRLLSETEQRLFERLSVFAGGFTLEAAGHICGFMPLSSDVIVDLVTTLADKSLIEVRQTELGNRHYLLQTIRRFSQERLAACELEVVTDGLAPVCVGMIDYMSRRHVEYFTQLAEHVDPLLKGPDQAIWLRRMNMEADNNIAALDWCVKSEQFEIGLRLATALWRVFYMTARFEEGYNYIRSFLSRVAADANPSLFARGSGAAGILAYQRADYTNARKHFEDVVELADLLDRPLTRANAFANLGNIESFEGNFARAQQLQLDGLAIYKSLDQKQGSAVFLSNLASNATRSKDSASAIRYSLEALAEYRDLGDGSNVAILLENLAEAYLLEGRNAEAVTCISEALDLSLELQNWRVICECHSLLLTVSASDGEWRAAANLAGMHRTLHKGLKLPLTSPDLQKYVDLRQMIEANLGAEQYRSAYDQTAHFETDQCTAYMKAMCTSMASKLQ